MVTVNKIKKAFFIAFKNIIDNQFSKTLRFHEWNESDLLPGMRFFLLGYFGAVEPEAQVKLPTSKSGLGRLDFIVGNVAVELAVRPASAGSSKISRYENESEIVKLLMYQGKAALVLFDFSKTPFLKPDLNAYEYPPYVGKGNRREPYSLLYYFKGKDNEPQVIRKNIKLL